jgi:hypothetical protein
LIFPSGGWAWLRNGDAELMLNTPYDDGERPEKPDPTRLLEHQNTGLFIGRPDFDGAYEYLLAKGVDVSTKSCLVRDATNVLERSGRIRDLLSVEGVEEEQPIRPILRAP